MLGEGGGLDGGVVKGEGGLEMSLTPLESSARMWGGFSSQDAPYLRCSFSSKLNEGLAVYISQGLKILADRVCFSGKPQFRIYEGCLPGESGIERLEGVNGGQQCFGRRGW